MLLVPHSVASFVVCFFFTSLYLFSSLCMCVCVTCLVFIYVWLPPDNLVSQLFLIKFLPECDCRQSHLHMMWLHQNIPSMCVFVCIIVVRLL